MISLTYVEQPIPRWHEKLGVSPSTAHERTIRLSPCGRVCKAILMHIVVGPHNYPGSSLSRHTRAKLVNTLIIQALGPLLFIKRVKRTSPNTYSSNDLSNLVSFSKVLGSSYLIDSTTSCCNSSELTASCTSGSLDVWYLGHCPLQLMDVNFV